jgi:cytidylate kinase
MEKDNKYVITIGRQFGSGGREIGKKIAENLGIKYYDKELLREAAKSSGMNEEFFEAADERTPTFYNNLMAFNYGYSAGAYMVGSMPLNDDNIYRSQCEVMQELARQSSCVIVGRSADFVLRKHPRLISVFIHASMESRIARILSRCDCKTENEAKSISVKKDKLRANYYNFYTDNAWGNSESYDLSVDSSKLSVDDVAKLIISYVKLRLPD